MPATYPPSVTTVSDQIFAYCSAALGTTASRCDGITASTIDPTKSSDLKSIYMNAAGDKWRIIGLLLEADFIGKSCQIKQNGMYDWIQSISKRVGPKRMSLSQINSGLWEMFPFIKMERKGLINNEFWNVTSGTLANNNTPPTTNTPSSAVPNGVPYNYSFEVASQTGIPADPRWFTPRLRVEIGGTSPSGSHTQTEWEVVASEPAGTPLGSRLKVYAKTLNKASALNADKIIAPTTGLLVRGTPNVSDYDYYCPEIPGLNTRQLTPFFIETTRWSYRICELMEKYLAAIRANNPYFKEFGDVESVELNRQIQMDFERREAWAFFFNKPYEHQNLNEYDQLPPITIQDGTVIKNSYGGRVIGRRAAATGIYELHAQCGRVFDLQGQVMNLTELFDAIYQMLRVRESIGTQTDYVEMWTDDHFAMQFQQGMFNYYASKVKDPTTGSSTFRVNYDICGKCNNAPFGFRWRSFQIDFPYVELRVVTHPFFNDLSAGLSIAGGASLATSGRVAWFIDWNVNYQMIFDANSVMLGSGDLNRLAEVDFASYGCVMKLPRDRQKLMSKTYSNINECPAASMFLENFPNTVPEHKGTSGSTYDLYGGVS